MQPSLRSTNRAEPRPSRTRWSVCMATGLDVWRAWEESSSFPKRDELDSLARHSHRRAWSQDEPTLKVRQARTCRAGGGMRQGLSASPQTFTLAPPVVRRGQHFLHASAAPRVPTLAAVPAGAPAGHPSPHRSFLGGSLGESLSHGKMADRASAEFRLPGPPAAGRRGTFWRRGPPGRPPRR